MKELLDITTKHASGEEDVRAIFMQNSRKAAPGGGWGAPTTANDKGTKKGIKNNKRGERRRPQLVTVTTICGEDNNGMDAGDYDDELVAAAKRDFK
jgi:hypothetical protein